MSETKQVHICTVVFGYLPLLSSLYFFSWALFALPFHTDSALFPKNVLFRERTYAASGRLCLFCGATLICFTYAISDTNQPPTNSQKYLSALSTSSAECTSLFFLNVIYGKYDLIYLHAQFQSLSFFLSGDWNACFLLARDWVAVFR